MNQSNRSLDRWLILVFVICLAMLTWGMVAIRNQWIAQLDTPTNQASWEAWREETRRLEAEPEHALRRAASSQQLPLVVLLRDHFVAVLLGVLATLSVPLAVILWVIRAQWKTTRINSTS